MAMLGAGGETEDQIRKGLKLPSKLNLEYGTKLVILIQFGLSKDRLG
jgi:hypothetical protein